MKNGGMILTGESVLLAQNLFQFNLSTTNLTRIGLGSNPGLRLLSTAINHLTHGAAL
jgi:hypothetical protein